MTPEELEELKNYYKRNKTTNFNDDSKSEKNMSNNNIEHNEDDNDADSRNFFREFIDSLPEIKFNFNFSDSNYGKLLATLAAFFFLIFVGIYIADSYIIPSYVHNRQMISIPNVVGLSYEEAIDIIERHNLKYEVSAEQFASAQPPGTVLDQKPAYGGSIKVSRPIYLTISKGNQTVTVPNLKGLSARTAKVALMNVGLNLGEPLYEFSEFVAKDSVISQNVKPGTNLVLGDSVLVVVSKGSENSVIVPRLVGMPLDEVKILLENYGLKLGSVRYEFDETFAPGVVIDQFPFANESFYKYGYVDVTVSLESN